MGATTPDSRPPVLVIVLVAAALLVVGMLLAQTAINFVFGLIRLAVLLIAFAAMGSVGLYLWRRGEPKKPQL